MEKEIWKNIEGFEMYQISSYGRVRSLKFNKEKILKQTNNGRGYYVVKLYKNNVQKTFLVHQLVAKAFISNPKNKPQINHINGIKTDNKVTNLEWVSAKQNIKHAWNTGLMENARTGVKIMIESNKKPIYSSKLDLKFDSIVDAANYIQSNYYSKVDVQSIKVSISDLLNNKITKSIYNFGWQNN